jgi:hypothetical protein
MPKHRIGTIQSFRPGYGAFMPQSVQYGKPSVHFQECALGKRQRLAFPPMIKWHGQQGSNLRPAVLEPM